MSKIIDGKASASIDPYDFFIPQLRHEPTHCRVIEMDYQRNGVSGAGFFVLRFMCSESPERPLVGIVFDYDPHDESEPLGMFDKGWRNPRTAVIDPSDLTRHWRRDHFDQGLRDCIRDRYEQIWAHTIVEQA